MLCHQHGCAVEVGKLAQGVGIDRQVYISATLCRRYAFHHTGYGLEAALQFQGKSIHALE